MDMLKMDAYLMCAAGLELNAYQREKRKNFLNLIKGNCRFSLNGNGKFFTVRAPFEERVLPKPALYIPFERLFL
jgi:hypothetical protein